MGAGTFFLSLVVLIMGRRNSSVLHLQTMSYPSPRQMAIWFLAPALLVGVAGVHSYFAAAKNQTPWEGGGFGMFSTVDKRQARFVRCSLITPTDTARVRWPDHLYTYVQRLRARPTDARVTSLAQYLADATWIVAQRDSSDLASEPEMEATPRYRFLPPHESSERPQVDVQAVRVKVMRYRFVSRPYGLEGAPLTMATESSSTQ